MRAKFMKKSPWRFLSKRKGKEQRVTLDTGLTISSRAIERIEVVDPEIIDPNSPFLLPLQVNPKTHGHE